VARCSCCCCCCCCCLGQSQPAAQHWRRRSWPAWPQGRHDLHGLCACNEQLRPLRWQCQLQARWHSQRRPAAAGSCPLVSLLRPRRLRLPRLAARYSRNEPSPPPAAAACPIAAACLALVSALNAATAFRCRCATVSSSSAVIMAVVASSGSSCGGGRCLGLAGRAAGGARCGTDAQARPFLQHLSPTSSAPWAQASSCQQESWRRACRAAPARTRFR
jgi:hypothetical protein